MNTTIQRLSLISGRVALRSFSSECVPAQRLRSVLEEYRRQNFSRETPARFKKELLKAAQTDSSGAVAVDHLNQILINIGRPEERLSEEEMTMLLREAGVAEASRSIPASAMMQLV